MRTVTGLRPLKVGQRRKRLGIWWTRPKASSLTRKCGNPSHTHCLLSRCHGHILHTLFFSSTTNIFIKLITHKVIKLGVIIIQVCMNLTVIFSSKSIAESTCKREETVGSRKSESTLPQLTLPKKSCYLHPCLPPSVCALQYSSAVEGMDH